MRQLTSEQWARVEEVFHKAAALSGKQRAEFLSSRDLPAWLQEAVGELLAADAAIDPDSDRIADVDAGELGRLLEDEDARPVSDRVGHYRIEEEIGRGGSSVVYLATREEVGGRVALKLLRRDPLAEPEARQRFFFEHQVLARLEHPHIAPLYDAGVTDGGTPYLAMEYVNGQPLTDYSNEQDLGLNDRLKLFLQLCDAMAYAHRNLIIHRDLKPGNIFVDSAGRLRVLDFGIAKLQESDGELESPRTRTGARLMTMEYAAPEQIRGEPVTTAVDVYGLGVVLYELLGGRRPFEERDRSRQIEQSILHHVPANPSTIAVQNRLRWASRVAGDLDAVIMKALRKEPAERFASVAALADELERYLAGQPLLTRRGTWAYRSRKFVARNRWGVAVSTFAALALLAFAWRESKLRTVAEDALLQAQVQVERNERIADFMVDLFNPSDPLATDIDQSRNMTAREMLDRGVRRLQEMLADQPQVRAALLEKFGDAYFGMERFDDARKALEEAIALRRTGRDQLALASALSRLARVAIWTEQWDEVAALESEALALREGQLEPPHSDIATSLSHLGSALMMTNRFAEAEPYLTRALHMRESALGPDRLEVSNDLHELGMLRLQQARFQSAEELFRRSLAIREALFDKPNPYVPESYFHISHVLIAQDRLDEAEPFVRKALEIYRTLAAAGGSPGDVGHALTSAANLAEKRGRFEAAEVYHREALSIDLEVVGPDHSWTVTDKRNLARVLIAQARLAEAEQLLTESIASNKRSGNSEYLARDEGLMGRLLEARGDIDTALAFHLRSAAGLMDSLGPGHPSTAEQVAELAALADHVDCAAPASEPDAPRLSEDQVQHLWAALKTCPALRFPESPAR